MRLSLRSLVAFTALGLGSAVAGGSAAAAPATPPLTAPAPAAAPTPHGVVQIIGEALTEVTLRPDQESAVEAISREIEPLQVKVDDAENGLLLGLADQVQTGNIDRAALEPLVAAYVDARLAVSGDLRAAIESLHDLLDTTQREDFADAVECRVHDVRQAMLAGENLDAFAQRLSLDDAQKQKVSDGLQQIAPALEHERSSIHRTIEGLREDSFAVEDYLPLSELPERARQRAERIIDLTESIVGVLDSVQLQMLADRIRQAAASRGDEPTDEQSTPSADAAPAAPPGERLGAAAQHIWAAGGVRRGPFGGVRGGVVVGGAGGYYFGRARAFPYAAGWGVGW